MAIVAFSAVLEETSTVTAKGQTTIPKSVRAALRVDAGDRIAFRVDDSGVTIRRATEEHADPVIGAFLSFLAKDMARRPREIETLTPELARRIAELTDGVEVDLDAPIEGDVAL